MSKRYYFDYAAATPVEPEVAAAMMTIMENEFGNANSLHDEGAKANKIIEDTRLNLKKFLNADEEDEIFFTASATESNNLAVQGVVRNKWLENIKQAKKDGLSPAKVHLILSQIEHEANLAGAKALVEEGIAELDLIKVDQAGKIDLNDLKQKIRPQKTALVSIIHGHYQFGTIQDLAAVAEIVHTAGAMLHTDAAQTFGAIPIDVKQIGVDLLTASAAKIYGPKGVALLYKKAHTSSIKPIIYGGGQEKGIRSGTLATSLIVGFGKAVEIAMQRQIEDEIKLTELRNYLIKRVLKEIPEAKLNGVEINDNIHDSDKTQKNSQEKKLSNQARLAKSSKIKSMNTVWRLPNNAHFSIAGVEGEALLLTLNAEGIAVSTGSACSSKSLQPDHSLLALGLGPEYAHGSIRITLGRNTTKEEIDYLLENLKKAVIKLKKISPFN